MKIAGEEINLIFMAASVVMFLFCLYYLVIRNMRKGKRIPAAKRMLISTGCIIFALGFFHFSLLYDFLPLGENMFTSFIKTLQSFSMDLDYESYLEKVDVLRNELFPNNAVFSLLTLGYAYIVGFLAPIFGGAILLEVITTIFPSLKLRLASVLFWKDFCYFSELNDRSLALAKSINNQDTNFFTRKIIVFTDAYSDEAEETETERLYEAKSIGAIILKKDIRHLRVRKVLAKKYASNSFFLIDGESREINNLQTLTNMLTEENYYTYKKSYIYLFMQSDVHEFVEVELFRRLSKKAEEDKEYKRFDFEKYADEEEAEQQRKIAEARSKGEEPPKEITRKKIIDMKIEEIKKELLPSVKLIRSYGNIVENLLIDVPLFSSVLSEKQKLDEENEKLVNENRERKTLPLNVTVFGTGVIGTEMFLSSYWCGQMLDCDLYINLVSQEKEEDFKKKIDCINSDIFASGMRAEEMVNDRNILRIYPDTDKFAPPYFRYRYYRTNIKEEDLQRKLNEPIGNDEYRLIDSDYILVALGSDEENLRVATEIKRYLSIDHMKNKDKKTVVAYVIYDSDLCRSLRSEKYISSANGIDTNVFMYPFGSLDELYSCENIFMEKVSDKAEKIGIQYDISRRRVSEKSANVSKRRKDEYSYWADIARSIHLKYKVFSAGMLRKTVFDDGYTRMSFDADWAEFSSRYNIGEKNREKIEIKDTMQNRLAWLEHRRWCAFMRIKGFRCPEKAVLYEYMGKTRDHKNLEMKLHPCLVECDERGLNTDLLTKEKLDNSYDMLDHVSFDVHANRKLEDDYDFKKYDYPSHGDT